MKNKIIVIFTVFAIGSSLFAQQTNDWKGIFLDPTGNHIQHGVEAYFKQSVCNGRDVVIIKFVNTNNYDVELSWFNAFFTTSKTWIKHNQPGQKITYILPANTTGEGNCQSENQLVFSLDRANLNAGTFLRLTTEYLNIKKMN